MAGKREVIMTVKFGSKIERVMLLLVHSPCTERKNERGEGGKERKKFLVSWFHKRQKIHCLDLWFLKTFTCNVVLKTHLALYDLTGLGRNRQCIEPALGCVVFCFCVYNIPYYHQKNKKNFECFLILWTEQIISFVGA